VRGSPDPAPAADRKGGLLPAAQEVSAYCQAALARQRGVADWILVEK